jgi:hypothetical protein
MATANSRFVAPAATFPSPETMTPIPKRVRSVTDYLRDNYWSSDNRLPGNEHCTEEGESTLLPEVFNLLLPLVYSIYGRSLEDMVADSKADIPSPSGTGLFWWGLALPNDAECKRDPQAFGPSITYHAACEGWPPHMTQLLNKIFRRTADLLAFFELPVWDRSRWIPEGQWLVASLPRGRKPLDLSDQRLKLDWCRMPLFGLRPPKGYLPPGEANWPPLLPPRVAAIGTRSKRQQLGIPVEWLNELDQLADRFEAELPKWMPELPEIVAMNVALRSQNEQLKRWRISRYGETAAESANKLAAEDFPPAVAESTSKVDESLRTARGHKTNNGERYEKTTTEKTTKTKPTGPGEEVTRLLRFTEKHLTAKKLEKTKPTMESVVEAFNKGRLRQEWATVKSLKGALYRQGTNFTKAKTHPESIIVKLEALE